MRRFLLLFLVFSLFAADDEEEKGVRFRFNFPYQQKTVVGEPPATDAKDHGHSSLSEAQMEKLQATVTDFINQKRKRGGEFTMRDMVELYHLAQDFKVVHALLGDLITPRESWEIGTLRQKMHEEVLRNLAETGDFGHRMGVNDFGSGADPNKVDAKTDIDFTGYAADQGLTGKEIVARYQAEFRKVAAKYYKAVNPGQMDIVAHAYEATIPDWRQNNAVSSYELRMRTGLGLLAKNPEAYFLEGAYLQQVMRRSADPAAKTFAWYEKNEKGELVKRMVNATEVRQFFYQPDIAPRYAWGAAVGNWHFFHAHSDDLIAQAKYILRSMDDGAGLLMGKGKGGDYEKLTPSQRDKVIRKLIRPFFGARDVAEMRAMMDTAAHMRGLKSKKALKLGSLEGKIEAYRPLIEYQRVQAGGLPMSDEELLRLAEHSFQSSGQKLLLHNNIITSRERLKDWLMPPLRPGERMDFIDEHGRRRIFEVDADMIKRLQYSSFFELKAGLALMSPDQVAKIKRANPKFANDITILERVIKKQKELYNGPQDLKPREILDFKERLLLDIRADWWNIRSKIEAKGVRSGVWAASKAAMARGDQIETWAYNKLFDGVAKLGGGTDGLARMEKLRKAVAQKQQQGLGTKWTMRLDRATSLMEIAKAYQREGEWNNNVWKVVFYEGMSYLPGMGTVYGIQGGISGVTTMTLVRLIPGYGQIVVVGQFVKSGVELVGLTIFEPLRHDRILLAYQGFLEPQKGGIFSSGQKERVESPRPTLFHHVDPHNELPLNERREKLYHYLHGQIVMRMLDDPRVWFTEDEFPKDWQDIEFEYVGKHIPEFVDHWWNATGPFAEFDELLGQRGPDIREPLSQRIQQDYLIGKQRAIQREMIEREIKLKAIQALIDQVASEDIALAEELKRVRGDLDLAGMLMYAAMLKTMPKAKPSMEIIAAPRTTDDGVIAMNFRAKVNASMEEHPAPWKITWKVNANGADEKEFAPGDGSRWEAERGSIKVKAIAHDAEGNLIIEKEIDFQAEKLGKDKDDEDEDEEKGEDEPPPEEGGGIPSIVGQSSSDVLTAQAQCQQGAAALEAMGQHNQQLQELGNQARERASQFGALADTILTDGRRVDSMVAEANQIGDEIARARDAGGKAALAACEALELIGKTRKENEKLALARRSEEKAVEAEEAFENIRAPYQRLREIAQKIRTLREAGIDVRNLHQEFHAAFGQLQPALSGAEEALSQARAADAELDVLTDKLQDYQTLARAAAAESESEQVAQDAATVEALVQSVGECPEELSTGIDEAKETFDRVTENLDEMEEGVEDIWSRLEESGLLGRIEESSQEMETLLSVVEMFFKSLRSYAKDARRCADLAQVEATEKEEVTVPDLYQKSLKVAEKLLFDAKLIPRRVAGSPAPTTDLEFHVEAQDPAAGETAESGDRVTMKLYGKSASLITVPSLRGMSISEAESTLRNAKLAIGKSGGSPAPTEDLSFKVESQTPSAGDQVDEGTQVIVKIHSRFVETVTVPDVRGMTRVQAVGYLRQKGFKVGVKTRREAPNEENSEVVWDQSPEGGAVLQGEAAVSITAYEKWVEEEEEIPVIDEEEGPEYILVLCDSYFPKIPDNLPEGMKIAEYLGRLTIGNANLQPIDQQTIITVGGEGLKKYPPEFFTVGKSLSSNLRIAMQGGAFDGALLLKVRGVYTDPDEINRRLGGGDWRKAPSGLIALPIQREDGYFDVSATNEGQTFRMSGGPLKAGWSRDARHANLRMFKQIAAMFDCFIATAIYQDFGAPELKRLRNFRDQVLLKSVKGQELVRHYYRVGPRWAQKVYGAPQVRRVLLPLITLLSETVEPEKAQEYEWLIDLAHKFLLPWLEKQEERLELDPFELLPAG